MIPVLSAIVVVTCAAQQFGGPPPPKLSAPLLGNPTPPPVLAVAVNTEIFGETPQGAVDGVNRAFTLAGLPQNGTVRLYWNGLRQKEGLDYLRTDGLLVLRVAPRGNDVLLVDYRQ